MSFSPIKIPPGRYCNKEELTGHIETDPQYLGKPLFPHLPNLHVMEDAQRNSKKFLQEQPECISKIIHIKLPKERISTNTSSYQTTNSPLPLSTVTVSITLIPKKKLKKTDIIFNIKDDKIIPLKELIQENTQDNKKYILTNFGFFTTPNLIYSDHPASTAWAHNKRYTDIGKIVTPNLSPYLGFYYHSQGEDTNSTTHDTNRGMLAIDKNGQPQIMNDLQITEYAITFHDKTTHNITAINELNPDTDDDVCLYHAGISTPTLDRLQKESEKTFCSTDDINTYNEIITNNRINLFITNRGDGNAPYEYCFEIWPDAFPISTFGSIISFSKEYFFKTWESVETFKEKNINQKVSLIPTKSNIKFNNYKKIFAASLQLISNYTQTVLGNTAQQITDQLHTLGFTSPNIQLGLESKNFCPVVREPANSLIETENYIGTITFSGRYELSIGAGLIDQIQCISIIQNQIPEKIKNYLLLDGGSAAKTIYINNKEPYILNIPAPSSRVPMGDVYGNIYSAILFEIL